MSRHVIACAGLAIALAGCAASVAGEAPEYLGRRREGYPPMVTAESRYGSSGTVTAPVRPARDHARFEVRLPGGTWVDCHLSCSETLRRETIDFWQNHEPRSDGADGPGYFIWRR